MSSKVTKINNKDTRPTTILPINLRKTLGKNRKLNKKNDEDKKLKKNNDDIFEEEFKNKLELKYTKLYHPCGAIFYEGMTRDGRFEDTNGKLYWNNSNLNYEGVMLDGKKHGYGKECWKNGNLLFEGIFKNGSPDGLVTLYHNNCKISYTGYYKNGVKYGKGVLYDYSGEVLKQGNWENGIYTGKIIEEQKDNQEQLPPKHSPKIKTKINNNFQLNVATTYENTNETINTELRTNQIDKKEINLDEIKRRLLKSIKVPSTEIESPMKEKIILKQRTVKELSNTMRLGFTHRPIRPQTGINSQKNIDNKNESFNMIQLKTRKAASFRKIDNIFEKTLTKQDESFRKFGKLFNEIQFDQYESNNKSNKQNYMPTNNSLGLRTKSLNKSETNSFQEKVQKDLIHSKVKNLLNLDKLHKNGNLVSEQNQSFQLNENLDNIDKKPFHQNFTKSLLLKNESIIDRENKSHFQNIDFKNSDLKGKLKFGKIKSFSEVPNLHNFVSSLSTNRNILENVKKTKPMPLGEHQDLVSSRDISQRSNNQLSDDEEFDFESSCSNSSIKSHS